MNGRPAQRHEAIMFAAAALLALALCAAAAAGQGDNGAASAATAPSLNPVAALPAPADLPGFRDYRLYPAAYGKAMQARRPSDGLQVSMRVHRGADAADAVGKARRPAYTPQGMMPGGSFSGRRLGASSWRSHVPPGQARRGDCMLIAQDGVFVVVLTLTLPAEPAQGRPVPRVFSNRDLRLGEDLVRMCLSRLRALEAPARSGPASGAGPGGPRAR